MFFANPLGLLALLALPAIVVIHLYHRRFPPLVVAGMHLWGVEAETRAAGRRRERLPVTASLLLELLAALLLALILAQPRIGPSGEAPHFVVVLDNSASMSAAPPGEKSFRDEAAAVLEQRIAAAGRSSRATLILTGRRPVLLAGPAVPWNDARELLERWRPSEPRHEWQPAWDLAAQLVDESDRLLFLTNRMPAASTPTPRQMELVSLGRKLDNIAITAARWTFDSRTNQGKVFVRIENFGRHDVDVTVTARAAGSSAALRPLPPSAGNSAPQGPQPGAVFETTVRVPSGGAVPLETAVPGGLGELAVTTRADGDGLALDNAVTLIEPKPRMLSISLTLPGHDPAVRPVQRVLKALPDWQPAEPETAHLVIGPADSLPPSRPDLWWLGIGPLDRSEAAGRAAKDLVGPFLLEKHNPLLEDVVLGGVVWGGVQPVEWGVVPVISAGSYPLLSRLRGTQTTGYLLNIDLARSNLPESPDWPILLGNLVELRRQNLPGLRRWNYRLNEQIRFRLYEGTRDPAASGSGELVLVRGNQTRPLARTAVVEIPPLDEPGVYEVRDGHETIGRFAVNFFDADESQLLALAPGVRAPAVETRAATFALDNPYSWLILAGLALVLAAALADWAVVRPNSASSRSSPA